MPWKLRPAEYITEFTNEYKFYKVKTRVDYYGQVPTDYAIYKKWFWNNCGDSWAITQPMKSPWQPYGSLQAELFSYFYVGFKDGVDKMAFTLAHDPEQLHILENNLKVFVREWSDK